MKWVAKFESFDEEPHRASDGEDRQSFTDKRADDNSKSIEDKLEDHYAIYVSKDQIEKFLNIVNEIDWIDSPKYSPEYGDDYFILIGRKLYHTKKPQFGGEKLKTYTLQL